MTRILPRVALASVILLQWNVAAALAQEEPVMIAERLHQGDPVRAFAPSARKHPCKGRFEAVRSDSLVILDPLASPTRARSSRLIADS